MFVGLAGPRRAGAFLTNTEELRRTPGGLFLTMFDLSTRSPKRNPCPSDPVAELAVNDFPRHIHARVYQQS